MKTRDSDLYYAAQRALKYVRHGTFLAEHLLEYAENYLDAPIPDKRAFGPVIRCLINDRWIQFVGAGHAKTSNGSLKPRYKVITAQVRKP